MTAKKRQLFISELSYIYASGADVYDPNDPPVSFACSGAPSVIPHQFSP